MGNNNQTYPQVEMKESLRFPFTEAYWCVSCFRMGQLHIAGNVCEQACKETEGFSFYWF